MSHLYAYEDFKKNLPPISEEMFPFLSEKRHIISLVGGGGKTTLLYLLAEFYASKGFRTLVTTTTHIEEPAQWAKTWEEIECFWEKSQFAVVGLKTAEGKLTSLPDYVRKHYFQRADVVLIEADGAKRLPAKVPAAHEPVILEECNLVIGVMGMSACNRPLHEICFRTKQAAELLGTGTDSLLTPERMAEILSSPMGTRKHVGNRMYYVVLTQCSTPVRLEEAKEVRAQLKKRGIEHVILF